MAYTRNLGDYSQGQIRQYLLDNGIIDQASNVIDAGRLAAAQQIYGWSDAQIDAARGFNPTPGTIVTGVTTPEAMRDYFISRGYITMAGDVLDPHGLYTDAAANGWTNAQVDAAMMTTTRFTNPAPIDPVSPGLSGEQTRRDIDPNHEWDAQRGDILEDLNPRPCGAVPAVTGGLSSVTDVNGYPACRWTVSVNIGLAEGWVFRRSDLLRLPPASLPPVVVNSSPTPMPSAAPAPAPSAPVASSSGGGPGAQGIPSAGSAMQANIIDDMSSGWLSSQDLPSSGGGASALASVPWWMWALGAALLIKR